MYTDLQIGAGHWPFFVQFSTMAPQNSITICNKLHRWPFKISAWPVKPEGFLIALRTGGRGIPQTWRPGTLPMRTRTGGAWHTSDLASRYSAYEDTYRGGVAYLRPGVQVLCYEDTYRGAWHTSDLASRYSAMRTRTGGRGIPQTWRPGTLL